MNLCKMRNAELGYFQGVKTDFSITDSIIEHPSSGITQRLTYGGLNFLANTFRHVLRNSRRQNHRLQENLRPVPNRVQ
jgi:hypothetical protein